MAGYIWRRMILKELFNTLIEELDGRRLAPGDPGRPVRGLAIDEDAEGWLGPDEVVVTSREKLDSQFLATVAKGGAPAVVWRVEDTPTSEAARQAEELGLGLLALPSRLTSCVRPRAPAWKRPAATAATATPACRTASSRCPSSDGVSRTRSSSGCPSA
ncbi:MAG: hypothetical protein LC781_01290 [Actinobacteria bacterium]|nr:hypothetical protein [Actinomycetota bacterium]